MVRPIHILLIVVLVIVSILMSPVLMADTPEPDVTYEDGAGASTPAPPYPFKDKWTEGGIVTEKGSPVSFFHLTRSDHDGDLDKEVVANSSVWSFLGNPLVITREGGGTFSLGSVDVEDIDTSCDPKRAIFASFKSPNLESVGWVTVAGPGTVTFSGTDWEGITSFKVFGGTCGGWFGVGSDVWIDNITLVSDPPPAENADAKR